jgi:exopolysaccharide biosynthesis polyprenyl glycosylphosphotransferase
MKNGISLIYNIFLVLGDVLALVAAFVAAYIVRVSLSSEPFPNYINSETYLGILITLLPFWIFIFALLGLYNSSIYEKRFQEFGRLAIGSFIGFMFVILWNFVTVEPIFPAKLVPVYGLVFGFIFLVSIRTILRSIRTALFRVNIGITNVLIIGNTSTTSELKKMFMHSEKSGYRILGVIGDKRRGEHADFASFEEALKVLRDQPIHGIIQTELYPDEFRNREILDYAQTHHLSYRFVPGNSELFVGNLEVELIRSSIPVITVHQTALLGWGRVAKRIFDIGAAIALLVVTSPILLIIAIANTFVMGGVFFRQQRLTRHNRVFGLYKFQTAKTRYNNMSPEAAFTKMGHPELIPIYRENGDYLPNDPRYGTFGSFLRASSLDELPQLFNVLKGDISLVGPRALVPEELDAYAKKHTILSVKSGVTGLAQISGRRELPFEERRTLDLYYVQNWSFWLDITILFKTLRIVINRTGAK